MIRVVNEDWSQKDDHGANVVDVWIIFVDFSIEPAFEYVQISSAMT